MIDYHDIEDLLVNFEYEHLEDPLKKLSKRFHDMAYELARTLRPSHQLHWGLTNLLVAKDACVRAALQDRGSLLPEHPAAASPPKSHVASDRLGVLDEAPSAAETMVRDQPRNVVHPVDLSASEGISGPQKAMLCAVSVPGLDAGHYCVLLSGHRVDHSDHAVYANGRILPGPGALRW